MSRTLVASAVLLLAIGAGPALRGQQDQVAALKESLQQGLAQARQYEWIETTTIRLKGEEKGRTQKRCYYGADGQVVKIALDQPAQPSASSGGGRRGGRVKQQVVAKKKDEMKDYMERAAALVHKYVPPAPQQIQAAKDAGHVSVTPQPDGAVRVLISEYLQPGDSVAIDLNRAANTLSGLSVNTWLDKPSETIALAVQMATLPDGALYAAQTTLDAKAKHITVVIENSGHRKATR